MSHAVLHFSIHSVVMSLSSVFFDNFVCDVSSSPLILIAFYNLINSSIEFLISVLFSIFRSSAFLFKSLSAFYNFYSLCILALSFISSSL